MSVFICDWAHRDVKEDVVIGRLWKLTFAGTAILTAVPAMEKPLVLPRSMTGPESAHSSKSAQS